MKIIWKDRAISRYFYHKNGEVGKHLNKQGKLVVAAAKAQVGKKKGALRASIHMRHYSDPRGQFLLIGSDLPYAKEHHEGTKPRIIVPKRRKTLRFFSKGAVFHTKMVKHPGTKPNKFLTDSLRLIK